VAIFDEIRRRHPEIKRRCSSHAGTAHPR
jgi:hypothetical protein